MRLPSFHLLLLLLFLAGIHICGSSGDSVCDLLAAAEDLQRPSSVLPGPSLGGSSSTSRSLLSYHHHHREHRRLIGSPDGTLALLDPRSNKIHWNFSTGSPLLHSEQRPSDIDEYRKEIGARKPDFTVEEFFHRTPVIKGSVVTIGSKTTSLFHVDADTGELLSKVRLPGTWPSFEASIVEEKTNSSKLDVDTSVITPDWIITILRTDYIVNSSNLGKPLWSMSTSTITASLSMFTGSKLELSASQQVNLPVYILKPQPQLMLSDKSYGSEESYSTAIIASNEKNIPFESEDETNQTGDYNQTSLGAPQNPEFGSFCQPENSDVFETNVADIFPFITSQNPMQLTTEGQILLSSSLDSTSFARTTKHIIFLMLQRALKFRVTILIFLILVLVIWKLVKLYKRSSQMRRRQSAVPKKRKVRKGGNTKNCAVISDHDRLASSEKESSESSETKIQSNLNPFINLTRSSDASDGRWVGRLFVSNSEIGRGSNGTVVLEGVYDGRPVAVKRLLRAHHDVAFKEIRNLIASDQHPNIVRWYGVEQDIDFIYISLERCKFSLSDLIQLCSDSSSDPAFIESPSLNAVIYHKEQLEHVKVDKDHELWTVNGFPSSQLLKLMRDVVSGLVHLHDLGIIHRDLKPQNVLISNDRVLNAKLSDMGISKRLLEDMSSLSHHTTGYGSSGWQAPEQLLHGRQTRAVDLFSLGCIIFFCITKGKHPFGNYYERDSNILNNRVDLFLVDYMPEAVHLLSLLLDANPKMRPTAVEVLNHPLFWNSETRLSFLRDASDRVELEDRESDSELLKALENISVVAFGGKWGEKLDAAFIADMGRYRKYNFDCTRDLLRVIRNKLNHYRELPKELQEILGSVPEGFNSYFSTRFPKLLIEVYNVVSIYCREEDGFSRYFNKSRI